MAANVATNAAAASHDAQVGGLVNIGEGSGQVALAAGEIVASDGVLLPLALLQGANGLLQMYNGFQQMFQPGEPPGVPVGGLTPAQDATLTHADDEASLAAAQSAALAIGDAVWNWVDGDGQVMWGLAEELRFFVLNYQTSQLIRGGFRGYFLYQSPNVLSQALGSLFRPPVFVPADVLTGDTMLDYLTRANPSWDVSLVDADTVLLEKSIFGLPVSVLCDAPWPVPGSVDYGCNPIGWLDLVYPFLTYTPSSGPPDRELFRDMQLLFSLLPVRYT
jgi:hypothetical protein